ncbi:MAG: NifU family protein [Anaerolineae bacterium]
MREKVESSLSSIRPRLQADGGDIELIDVNDEGVVLVRLAGACRGCPGAIMTLKMGIERILKEQIPEVKRVEATSTHHSAVH